MNDFVEEVYFKGKKEVPPVVGFVMGINVVLFFNRPESCSEIFMTKNKYFDKHPRSLKMGKKLFGDSILTAKSDMMWQSKRKVLSSALYKDKLKLMIDMIKDATVDSIRN